MCEYVYERITIFVFFAFFFSLSSATQKTLNEGRCRRQFVLAACSKIINQIDQVTISISIVVCTLILSLVFFSPLLLLRRRRCSPLSSLLYHLSIRVQMYE